jgi:hypothetical protein
VISLPVAQDRRLPAEGVSRLKERLLVLRIERSQRWQKKKARTAERLGPFQGDLIITKFYYPATRVHAYSQARLGFFR